MDTPPASEDVEIAVGSASSGEGPSGLKRANSIYDFRTHKQQHAILLVVSFASILLPFSDTIYLPALESLTVDLNTTATLAAASVAVYMFTVGVTALLWGLFADRYGRRLTYWICAGAFIASTIVCIFAPNIGVLMAFRALQGAAVTGYMTTGNAVIADIFPPDQRGRASGIFMIPTLVGPILGPLIGGALAHAFGWRSCFIALAIFAALALIAKLLVLQEETHQYYTLKRIRTKSGAALADSLQEAPHIQKPKFHAPWRPLRLIAERTIAPYAWAALINFAAMFGSLMVLPVVLEQPPYSLNSALIGVAYVPIGLGGFLVSPLGGRLADYAAGRYPGFPQGRLLPATLIALVLMPASLLTYGWTLHYKTNLAGPLIGHFFVGVALSVYFPAIFSYITVTKQQEAGSAAAAVQALMFIMAGVFVLISIPITEAIGLGPFVSILAGVVLVSFAASAGILTTLLQKYKAASPKEAPLPGAGGENGQQPPLQ